MNAPSPPWLAVDIGGANLKAAHSSGPVASVPFALWKQPERLAERLRDTLAGLPPADRLAVTMTAELCDCYPTKAAGVQAVLDAVLAVSPERTVRVWGIDGELHPPDAIRERPLLAAASNWLALATVAARLLPEGPGLLVDVGSTTTDLIPLRDGRPVPAARTDTGRLQSGELIYAGVRRTPLCALAHELPHRSTPTGLAAELFATTLDVYLTLGAIAADPADLDTADGRPATPEAALDRLARAVCADRDDFTPDDAQALARAADAALVHRLTAAAERACDSTVGPPRGAVVAGSGSFLARRLARRLIPSGGPIVVLDDAWGRGASSAACAYTLAILAAERGAVSQPPETDVRGERGASAPWTGDEKPGG